MIEHAALKNNQAYLLCTEITKRHPNNRICQQSGVKTNTVTPSFFTFLISPCPVGRAYQVSLEIYGGFSTVVLILGNYLKLRNVQTMLIGNE